MKSELSHIYNDEYIDNLKESSPLAILYGYSIVDCIEFLLSSQYKYITVQTDGSNWHIIADN